MVTLFRIQGTIVLNDYDKVYYSISMQPFKQKFTEIFGKIRDFGQSAKSEEVRQVIHACHKYNVETLWEFTCSFLLLESKSGGKISQHTLRAYKSGLKKFIQDMKESNQDLLKLERADAIVWVRELENPSDKDKKPLSSSSIGVRIAAIKNFYAALKNLKAANIDPFNEVQPAPDTTAKHEKRQPYPIGMLDILITAAKGEDKLLVLLCGHAGLRIAEALALHWDDIDFENHLLLVRSGKGGKKRRVLMSVTLEQALKSTNQETERIFSYNTTHNARRRLQVLCKECGVPYQGFHSLRHTAGTRHYTQTRDIKATSDFLGHSSMDTTSIYAHYAAKEVHQVVRDW